MPNGECGMYLNAECGMGNAECEGSVLGRTTLPCHSAFRTPHSAFGNSRFGNREPTNAPRSAPPAAPNEAPTRAPPRLPLVLLIAPLRWVK